MKLSIIIPVYNEKKTILKILKQIKKVNLDNLNFRKEIIIIDDCSVDGTSEILYNLKKKYKIFYHLKNKGKGASIKTGLKYASGDFTIIQDADLEYNPKDYRKLLEHALKNNADVVYGSRILNSKNKHSNLIYYIGGIFFTQLINILYKIKITDGSTGYKMFKTDILKEIPLKVDGFDFCAEITAKIAKKNIKIHEIPINYYPRNIKNGKKIRWWKDGFKITWTLIKYRFLD